MPSKTDSNRPDSLGLQFSTSFIGSIVELQEQILRSPPEYLEAQKTVAGNESHPDAEEVAGPSEGTSAHGSAAAESELVTLSQAPP